MARADGVAAEPVEGTWHAVYGVDGRAKGAIFVPEPPTCPDCRPGLSCVELARRRRGRRKR